MTNSLSIASAAAVLLLVGAAIGLYGYVAREESPRKGENAITAEIREMRELIQKNGGKRAYDILAEENKTLSFGVQHTRAHNFGAALYMEEGESGLSVCDARFSFGCFHEFLGRAIADLGIESVNNLNQKCRDALGPQSLSCQHGIGHGVLAYLGYDREHLDQALTICENMPFNDPIGGCYGGVFMEYNVRTMWGEDAQPREHQGSPHDPCSDYAGGFQSACYYWQPQWWRSTELTGLATPEIYAQMGSYCAEIPDAAIRLHCYEGIGNVTAQDAQFNPERAITLCKALPGEGPALLCRALAANHLGIDVSKETGEKVCEGYIGEVYAYCRAHAHNTLNIANRSAIPFDI